MPFANSVDSPAPNSRTEALHSEMQALARRDGELWCIGLLALVLLLIGLASVLFPALREVRHVQLDTRFIAPLAYGLVSLIVLLALHLSQQRRLVHARSEALLQQMAHSAQLEKMAFIDPATQLFNQDYLPVLLNHELKRANQHGTVLTFAVVELRDPASHGSDANFDAEVARLLRSNFRGADTIMTCGNQRYLVVMPDTSEEQATVAMRRLQARVDQWNMSSRCMAEMLLSYGLGTCTPGSDAQAAMEQAERKLARVQPPVVPAPVFAGVPYGSMPAPTN